MKAPLCVPLVPPRWSVPLNLRLPVAPLPLPLPPVALATPWKVIVTAPLSPLEQPCCDPDWMTTKVILFAPPVMLPFPPKGSHSDEVLFGAEPLPLALLAPKREFFPEPEIDEIVTVLLSISSEALPEYWPEKETALVSAAPVRAALAGVLALAAAAGKAGLAKRPTVAKAVRTASARNLLVRKGLLTMQVSIPVGDERPIGPKDPTLAAVGLASGLEVLAFLSLRCLFQTCP